MTNYLPNGYKLNSPCGEYTIESVIGRGATAIAYIATFCNANGLASKRILKECFPAYLGLTREQDGRLCCEKKAESKFELIKTHFEESGGTQSELRKIQSLTNLIPPILAQIHANNTVYLDVINFEGDTWERKNDLSFIDQIKICLSTAKSVERIHKAGYLCLDLKPSNILILDTTSISDDVINFIDFDSIRAKGNFTFGNSASFTEAWSAPEQINPYAYKNISEATDIYTLGELIFWSVFGRHSTDSEHRSASKYPFEAATVHEAELGRKSVQKILKNIFQNTLRSSAKNRYKSVEPLIEQLGALVNEISQKEYLVSSIPQVSRLFVGREKEVLTMDDNLRSNNVLFVCGIGGIGKSALIQNYCTIKKNDYDAILYLYYSESVAKTFADDNQVNINTIAKGAEETQQEYFERKIRCLKRLFNGKKLLIVLDNYNEQITSELKQVINANWKTIIATRKIPNDCTYASMTVEPVADKICLYRLFEANLGRTIESDEHQYIDSIFASVANHTLVIELIAKQVKNSYMSIAEAAELVKNHGFAHISSEKIDFAKDENQFYATISDIITAFFDASHLEKHKIHTLQILSLFDCDGVDINILQELLDLSNKDILNELMRDGWIIIDRRTIRLHPVIAETIRLWAWENPAMVVLGTVLQKLFEVLKIEDDKQEYPKKLANLNEKIKVAIERSPRLRKFMERFFVKDDYVRKVAYDRICSDNQDEPTDYKKLQQYVSIASVLLENCKRINGVEETNLYKDLLFRVVVSTPRYKDAYILEKAQELLADKKCTNAHAILKLYDLIVSICSERKDFDEAHATVLRAEQYVKKQRDHHIKALYFDLLATYYDAILNGSYDAGDAVEQHTLEMLMNAIEQSINHTRKSRRIDKGLWLARFMLSKVNVLIRSYPDRKEEIKSILSAVKKLLEENTLHYSELRCDYYMSQAWYYTLVEPYYRGMITFAHDAFDIGKKSFKTELDWIDKYIIPRANMFVEWKLYDEAAKWLGYGIQSCDDFADVVPYIRKKMDLMTYLLDTYFYAEDCQKCREIVAKIEQSNNENREFDIYIDIPDHIKELLEE